MMNAYVAKNLVSALRATTAASTRSRRLSSAAVTAKSGYDFKTLKVSSVHDYVFHVELNRPEKRNAMNPTFFSEYTQCFQQLHDDPDCRSIVVSGLGKCFTSGIDLTELSQLANMEQDDVGRRAFIAHKIIETYQRSMSAAEKCRKPVIACVHGYCIGGGLDLISACDIRYCTSDAWFTIKEVEMGLAADIGSLQRIPKIVGNESLVRELVYTSRRFSAHEALQLGLVSKVCNDESQLLREGVELAKLIASKSPVAVQGSKINLLYSRDHSVDDGLEFMKSWNAAMLQSEDLIKSAMGAMTKETPTFSKL